MVYPHDSLLLGDATLRGNAERPFRFRSRMSVDNTGIAVQRQAAFCASESLIHAGVYPGSLEESPPLK